ncbi:MAG: DnaB helicase C-terminal domain-containing protein [Patescibacteria group bacterium]|nr:DnaB helicase C-terminal domain-containing protein [Patescibacteria group bacterium]
MEIPYKINIIIESIFTNLLSEKLSPKEKLNNFTSIPDYIFPYLLYQELIQKIHEHVIKEGTYPSSEYLKILFKDDNLQLISYCMKKNSIPSNEYNLILEKLINYIKIQKFQDSCRKAYSTAERDGLSAAQEIITNSFATSESSLPPTIEQFDFKSYYEYRKNSFTGPILYIIKLDKAVGGIPPGKLVTIGAFTGNLKTTYSLNILYENCINLKYNGCFISTEMTKMEIISRLLVRHANNPKFREYNLRIVWSKLRNTQLTKDEESFLFNIVKPDFEKQHGKIYILDQRDLIDYKPSTFEALLIKIDLHAPNGLDFVIFDY